MTTTNMTAETMTPAYNVELLDDGKTHTYRVTHEGWNFARLFPGVTGVLGIISKPWLVPWAKKETCKVIEQMLLGKLDGEASKRITVSEEWIKEMIRTAKKRPEKIKDDAADLGTLVHLYIDRIVKGQRLDVREIPEQAWPALSSFQEWWELSGLTFISGDTKVASLTHCYGGSLDALAHDRDGKVVLLDWKTSNQFSEEYALQTAAYADALVQTFGVRPDRVIIARFTKMTESEWRKEKPRLKYIPFETRDLTDWAVSFQAFVHALELNRRMAESHYRK